MNNRVKSGLFFGIFMAMCFIVQNLLSYPHTSEQIIKSIVAGLISGALAGLIFGWLIGTSLFNKLVDKRKRNNQ